MSISPKKKHGPELKCGGPNQCEDCKKKGVCSFCSGFGYYKWEYPAGNESGVRPCPMCFPEESDSP